jgi:N-6 DNA Methylase
MEEVVLNCWVTETKDTRCESKISMMRKLRRRGVGTESGGRAAVVVPDGTLTGSGVAASIRRELLQEFNLYAIVQLPPGSFAPPMPRPLGLTSYSSTLREKLRAFGTTKSRHEAAGKQTHPREGALGFHGKAKPGVTTHQDGS